MSFAKGTGIRIITEDNNLFSVVVKDNGHSITVKLSQKYEANSLKSDLMEIIPVSEKQSFKFLSQYYSEEIRGFFINESTGEKKQVLSGTATID